MTDFPVLLVAGLGRCGTTMMMTMLDAGGFPVTGPRPSYEDGERHGDQARSQCKMLSAGCGSGLNLRVEKAMQRSIARDAPVLRAQLCSGLIARTAR